MFHCSERRKDEEEEMIQAADKQLQNALIMFPSVRRERESVCVCVCVRVCACMCM